MLRMLVNNEVYKELLRIERSMSMKKAVTTSIVSLYILVSIVVWCDPPTTDEFVEDFVMVTREDFRAEKFYSLPEERQNAYLDAPKEELEMLCAWTLWRGEDLSAWAPFQAYLACSSDPDLQARYTAYWVREGGVETRPMLLFYEHDVEQHIQWNVRVVKALSETPFQLGHESKPGLMLSVIGHACSAEKLDRSQRERCALSVLNKELIPADQLETARKNVETIKRILIAVADKEQFFWTLKPLLHEKTWGKLWETTKGEGFLKFHSYCVLGSLAGEKGFPPSSNPGEEELREVFEKWLVSIKGGWPGFSLLGDSQSLLGSQVSREQSIEWEKEQLAVFLGQVAAYPTDATETEQRIRRSFAMRVPSPTLSDKEIDNFIDAGLGFVGNGTGTSKKIAPRFRAVMERSCLFNLLNPIALAKNEAHARHEVKRSFYHHFPNPVLNEETVEAYINKGMTAKQVYSITSVPDTGGAMPPFSPLYIPGFEVE